MQKILEQLEMLQNADMDEAQAAELRAEAMVR